MTRTGSAQTSWKPKVAIEHEVCRVYRAGKGKTLGERSAVLKNADTCRLQPLSALRSIFVGQKNDGVQQRDADVEAPKGLRMADGKTFRAKQVQLSDSINLP